MSSNNKVAKRAFTIDPRRRRVRNGIGARKFKPTEVYAEFIESNINMKNLKLSSSARSMRAARLVAAALRFAQRPAAVVAVAAKTANMIVNLCSSEEKSEESALFISPEEANLSGENGALSEPAVIGASASAPDDEDEDEDGDERPLNNNQEQYYFPLHFKQGTDESDDEESSSTTNQPFFFGDASCMPPPAHAKPASMAIAGGEDSEKCATSTSWARKSLYCSEFKFPNK